MTIHFDVLFRDLKMDNILLDDNHENVKIIGEISSILPSVSSLMALKCYAGLDKLGSTCLRTAQLQSAGSNHNLTWKVKLLLIDARIFSFLRNPFWMSLTKPKTWFTHAYWNIVFRDFVLPDAPCMWRFLFYFDHRFYSNWRKCGSMFMTGDTILRYNIVSQKMVLTQGVWNVWNRLSEFDTETYRWH